MLARSFSRCRIFSRLLSSEITESPYTMPPKKPPGYYVVTHGFTPGIYKDYSRVLEQITGYAYGRFKKFQSYDEAYFYYFHARHTEVAEHEKRSELFEKVLKQAVAKEMREKAISASGGEKGEDTSAGNTCLMSSENDIVTTFCNPSKEDVTLYRAPKHVSSNVKLDETPRKSARLESQDQVKYSDDTDLDDEFSLQQFEEDIIKSIELESEKLSKRKRKIGKTPSTRNSRGRPKKEIQNKETGETFTNSGVPIVYTDGCCINNMLAETERKAGCGVFWGRDDPRNVIERLWGSQTNQRAELWATVRAVQTALQADYESLEIRTDSQYVISGMTEWILRWRKNNWTTAGNHPVKNRDMFALLDGLCCYIDVRWVKVKGHSSVYGNDMADSLARCGAHLLERKVPVLNPLSDSGHSTGQMKVEVKDEYDNSCCD